MKNKLWCDLKTDKERVEFIRSGRAVATGIMAQYIVDDVADAFDFRSRHTDDRQGPPDDGPVTVSALGGSAISNLQLL